MDFFLEDAVDHSVLLRYLTAPSAFGLSFQRFGMTQACTRMFIKFAYESKGFFVGLRFGAEQTFQVFLRFLFDDDRIAVHKARM